MIRFCSARHVLRRHLDAEIAARHHDRVGQLDDLLQPLDRRRLLELDQHRGAPADQPARLGDVLRPLHEGQRDPVDAEIEREAQVVRGPSRSGATAAARRPGTLTPLRSLRRAAGHDRGLGEIGAAALDPQPQLAVVEQQVGARLSAPRRSRDAAAARAARRPALGVEVEAEALRRP